MANTLDLLLKKMEKLGYKKLSESRPDQAIEAEMANEDASETWTGALDPIQLSEQKPFWWRPARGKDDLWMEIMTLRVAQGARVT
jgi:hypothetical protein